MKWTSPRVLFSIMFLWAYVPTISTGEEETKKKCDEELFIDPSTGKTYNISSPGYPDKPYTPGISHTWCLSAPDDMCVSIRCDEFDIPKSDNCEINALTVSFGEDNESRVHCGTKPFQVESGSSTMTVTLHSSKKSRGGKFSCLVLAEKEETYSTRAIVYSDCDCGYSYKMRIVGGEETGINEFPFMAGVVDSSRIVCGATIISPRYVVTADHCLEGLQLDKTFIVVGEHNVTTSSETSATRFFRVKRFIPYPYYNSDTKQYDIALIELASPITYSARVGPVCLPFSYSNYDLTGYSVTVLGWGTIEFGGPRSDVLKKVQLPLVDIQFCISNYGSNIDPYTQLCTYKEDEDACQYDSGGPLLYFDYMNRYELVGLVSYGRACATESPGVNTNVGPFLNWILDNTRSETYCCKTCD